MTNTFFRTILLFSLLIGIGYSQFKTPVTISTEVENSSRPGEVAHVLIKASMDDEWHIYALENAGEGPVASRIKISGDIVDEQGLIEHREPIEKFDEGFGVKTRFFKGTTDFRVPIRIKEDAPIGEKTLSVYMLYQVCN